MSFPLKFTQKSQVKWHAKVLKHFQSQPQFILLGIM